jgi:para-nitrobenzyl esterase
MRKWFPVIQKYYSRCHWRKAVSLLGLNPFPSLQNAEKAGTDFAQTLNKNSLADLRAIPAAELLKTTAQAGFGRFPICVDGYFFPKSPYEIYKAGEQA